MRRGMLVTMIDPFASQYGDRVCDDGIERGKRVAYTSG
jgi:hypothetical protein